jgi:hypothetical protein
MSGEVKTLNTKKSCFKKEQLHEIALNKDITEVLLIGLCESEDDRLAVDINWTDMSIKDLLFLQKMLNREISRYIDHHFENIDV